MSVANVSSQWVDGNLVFYDKSGNIIATWDGTNRKLTLPEGSTLEVAGVTVDADTLAMDGVTASAAELNLNDGAVAGTAVASKTLALGADKNVDVLAVADLKLGAGAGTSLTATAAELNELHEAGAVQADLAKLHAVTATAAELNVVDGMAANLTFVAAAAAANVCEVTISVVNAAAGPVAGVFNLDVWLSDAASGFDLTGTAASGTVTAKSGAGAVVGTYEAKKALRVQTGAQGIFVLEITDAAKTGYYVCATIPSTGATAVSAQLVAGDYGA